MILKQLHMPFIYLLLMVFVSNCAKAQLQTADCPQGSKIVICISKTDCVNCQYLLLPIVEKLRSNNCKLNFVLSGIPLRLTDEFFASVVTDTHHSDKVLHHSTAQKEGLMWNGVRSSVVIQNGLLTEVYLLGEYLKKIAATQSKAIELVDSADITNYWGAHASQLYVDTANSIFIYHDVRNVLYHFNNMNFESPAKHSLNSIGDKWNDSLIYLNPELNSAELALNAQKLSTSMFASVKIGQPYITNRYIYLPLTKFFMRLGYFSEKDTALVPYSYMFRFDKSLQLQHKYFFKLKVVEQTQNLYNSLSYGAFINDTTFMMNVSSMNRDSLLAIYHLAKGAPQLYETLNLTYPSHFQKISPNGHPIVYPFAVAKRNNNTSYFLNRENTFYTTRNKTIEVDTLGFLNCRYADSCYIEFAEETAAGGVGVVSKKGHTEIVVSKRGGNIEKHHISKLLQVAGLRKNRLYTYEFTDEKVMLYIYQLNL